ncbi:glycosyltransferase family 4 protein [Candidatus Omnitrophota bacterium]
MKIAFFHTTLPEPGRKISGVELVAHNLANELANNKDDEITVFSLSPKPKDAKYKHIHLFKNIKFLKNKFFRLSLLPFLLNFVNFKRYDVIHLHGDDWFFFKRSIASIRTLHGSALREAQYANSLKRKISQYIIYLLEKLSVKLATKPLAIGLDASKLYNIKDIVDNGVNPKVFSPGKKSENPSILFVGTWKGRKRGEFIFKIFVNKVLVRFPKAQLYMVTDFCPKHPNVKYVKFPEEKALSELFKKAWIFAYPSICEGFGIPYVEAIASGTAIISSQNQGAEYVLESGKYGIIAKDDLFEKEIIDLLKDTKKRSMLEGMGIKRAKRFYWKNVTACHKMIYQQVITEWKK